MSEPLPMYAWGAVLIVTFIFALLMLAMWREVRRPLDATDEYCARVDAELDEWPHPWTPGEVADASYRLGYEGGRSAGRRERGL